MMGEKLTNEGEITKCMQRLMCGWRTRKNGEKNLFLTSSKVIGASPWLLMDFEWLQTSSNNVWLCGYEERTFFHVADLNVKMELG